MTENFTDKSADRLCVGKLISVTGGLYVCDCGGEDLPCRARGLFRHEDIKPLVGDDAEILLTDDGDNAIKSILPRKNSLIRPPMANLDILLCVIACVDPEPDTLIFDKLITIAEHNGIEPVIAVTKRDLDPPRADSLAEIYRRCGFEAFVCSVKTGDGIDSLGERLAVLGEGKTSAVAGVSGAGKSSLLNAMFPSLSLETGELSHRISRGKNTTRTTRLFRLSRLLNAKSGYFADTPGFSLIDFEHFDFYDRNDLPFVFREFAPYLAKCRYTKCTHTKEDGCAVIEAVKTGVIPKSRHISYLSIYADIKDKREWNKTRT